MADQGLGGGRDAALAQTWFEALVLGIPTRAPDPDRLCVLKKITPV